MRGHAGQLSRDKLRRQVQEVALDDLPLGIELVEKRIKHRRERASLDDQVPRTRTHLVQTEIGAALEVEEHRLVLEMPEQHLITGDQRITQGDVRLQSAS